MFIYFLRGTMAIYFTIFYKGLLKPDVIRMVTIGQEEYLVKLKRTQLDTELRLGTAVLSEGEFAPVNWTPAFIKLTNIVFGFQFIMLTLSAILIQKQTYFGFMMAFLIIFTLEHLIMKKFYRNEATSFLMQVDRVIFVVNYIAYAIVILALLFL